MSAGGSATIQSAAPKIHHAMKLPPLRSAILAGMRPINATKMTTPQDKSAHGRQAITHGPVVLISSCWIPADTYVDPLCAWEFTFAPE